MHSCTRFQRRRSPKKARNGRLRQGLIDKLRATHHFHRVMSDAIDSLLSGDNTSTLVTRLRDAGLRPTRQRLALAALLLDGQHRHVSADSLTRDVLATGEQMALGMAKLKLRRRGYQRLNRKASLTVIAGLVKAELKL